MRPLVLLFASLAAIGCSSRGPTRSDDRPPLGEAAPVDAAPGIDLDQDSVPDRITEAFTGGAHCCYRVTLELGTGGRIALPFELDGGDPLRERHYEIVHRADGRPALRLFIGTYAGQLQALRPEERALGARSHRIDVAVVDGRVVIDNLGWRCEDAMQVIAQRSWDAWEGLPVGCRLNQLADALDATETSGQPRTIGSSRRRVTQTVLTPGDATQPPLRVAVDGDHVLRLDIDIDSAADRRKVDRAADTFGTPSVHAAAVDAWPATGFEVTRAKGAVVRIGLFGAVDVETYQATLTR